MLNIAMWVMVSAGHAEDTHTQADRSPLLQAYGDSDSDEDWLDDDSDDEDSSLPLDNMDVFSAFAQALAGMQVGSLS